jgi:septal ring factor EnvC (AmiA/AmiB activator)
MHSRQQGKQRDRVAWYDEWPALKPILEMMNMAECQRCRSFQADFEAQERPLNADEARWLEAITYRNEILDEWIAKARELERQLVESQRQNQQLQQQLDAMRESKQAACRAQCNADYMGSIGGRG